jgi:hypothetical protein
MPFPKFAMVSDPPNEPAMFDGLISKCPLAIVRVVFAAIFAPLTVNV